MDKLYHEGVEGERGAKSAECSEGEEAAHDMVRQADEGKLGWSDAE